MNIQLTKNQWARLSEILGNLGLAALVSLVVPSFIGQPNNVMIISGLVITSISWYTSLLLGKKY